MTPEEEKALREHGKALWYSLRAMKDLLGKRQMSADEWATFSHAVQMLDQYDELILRPYTELQWQARERERALAFLNEDRKP